MSATSAMSATPAPLAASIATPEVALADARFIDLVTFRRTGEAIGTPVLFVLDGDRLLVRTAADTGKLKRIRHTPRVQVVPSDQHGRHVGAKLDGTARILGPEAVGPTLARLHARYRIAGPLFSAMRRLRRQRDVIIEIDLAAGAAGIERRPAAARPDIATHTVRRTIGGIALTLVVAACFAQAVLTSAR